MKKLFLAIALLLSLGSYSQTLYVPNDPDPLKLAINVDGTMRSVTIQELTKKKLYISDFQAHASYGITLTDIANWNAKLGSYLETDPTFLAHVASSITSSNIGNWNTAYNKKIVSGLLDRGTVTLTATDNSTVNIRGFRNSFTPAYILSQNLDITFRKDDKQLVTLPINTDKCHSLSLYRNKYLLTATRDAPAGSQKFIRFNNLDDLTDYTMIDMPYGVTQIVVNNNTGKAYVSYTLSTTDMTLKVGEIDIETMALSMPINTVLTVVPGVTATPGPYNGTLASDGTYLFCGTGAPYSQIFKYRISDWTLMATFTNTIAGRMHNLLYDGQYLYASSYQNGPSTGGGTNNAKNYIVKVDPNTLTQVAAWSMAASFSSNGYINAGFTDDVCSVGDYLYLGYDWNSVNTSPIARIHKSLGAIEYLTIPSVNGTATGSYGLFYDGTYVWATLNNAAKNAGWLCRINPYTLEMQTMVMPAGEEVPNEMVFDGNRMFITYFLTPAKVGRYSSFKADYVDTKVNTLTYGSTTTTGVTGTSNLVLSASPALTGTVSTAAITASGLITGNAGVKTNTMTYSTQTEPAAPAVGTVVLYFDGTNLKWKRSDGSTGIIF